MTSKATIKIILDVWVSCINSRIFFVPVLGPVLIERKDIRKLLIEVLKNAQSDNFLAYDKNKRWFLKKLEVLFLDQTRIDQRGLCLFSADNFFETIKIYFYSQIPLDDDANKIIMEIARDINRQYDFRRYKLYCFNQPEKRFGAVVHNIYCKIICQMDSASKIDKNIFQYSDLSVRQQQTFSVFASEEEHDSLFFVWNEYLTKNVPRGPVFCYVYDNKIVGAIGPLDIAKDVGGNKFLQPPNFGVLERHKRRGIGGALWSAAMNYAFKKDARYTLVQNIPGSEAAQFYEKQGLEVAGQVFSLAGEL